MIINSSDGNRCSGNTTNLVQIWVGRVYKTIPLEDSTQMQRFEDGRSAGYVVPGCDKVIVILLRLQECDEAGRCTRLAGHGRSGLYSHRCAR